MSENEFDPARRRMLMRLGLAAGAVYSAPVLMSLGTARASSASFSAPVRRARPVQRAAPPPPPRPEIVVSAPDAAAIDAISAEGYELLSRASIAATASELARFVVPANLTIDEARAQINGLVPAAIFDINAIYRPEEMPCGDDSCAAFDLIGWKSAAHGCPADTVIGMIDTTVNGDHAALADVPVETFPVIAEGRQPGGAVHGTAVAILMAGRADTRTPGLLSGARIIAAEAFHKDATGNDAADTFDVVRALDEMVTRDISVVNLSFTGPDNAVLKTIVDAALARDMILVAAAGNAGPNADPLFPAAYEGVVAVTAVDSQSRVYRRANVGDHVDFAAPGVQLWTAASVSGGRYRSGTSYAAPFVSAALAAARTSSPDANSADLIDALAQGVVDLGEPGRDATFGWGLVQAPAICNAEGAARLIPAGG